MDEEESSIWAINVIIIIFIIYVIWYFIWFSISKGWECSTMERLYGKSNGKIQSMSNTEYNLRDYYIKSAYNCCNGGTYKNDYVSLCSLKSIIKQGARCLDFEVYSKDDKPVVASSSKDSICFKETFNYIGFDDIMDVLKHNAFGSLQNCPNPKDPLVLHLRVKSGNVNMFNNFAKILEGYDSILLGKKYSFENQGKNLGEIPLSNMMGKIIIIVDRTNNAFLESSSFREYVNLTSNSIFMRSLHYHDIKYSPDTTELTEYNKKFMTLGMPDKGSSPGNPSGVVLRETGCQFLCMRYQETDTYLQEMLEFFDLHGHAFVLKPERLRYKPVTVSEPKKQNKDLSYATKNIDGGFYNFNI
tara:strand:+ start:1123 stop:2196 length:1074 start_codon:yes stop_codon:yes gene_type:complete